MFCFDSNLYSVSVAHIQNNICAHELREQRIRTYCVRAERQKCLDRYDFGINEPAANYAPSSDYALRNWD